MRSETLRTVASRSFLPRRFEQMLQLKTDVEMILDGDLAAAGDDNNILHAGMNRLFHAVLNQRLIDQRKHFLGLRLGCRKKSGAEPGCGKYRFADFCDHRSNSTGFQLR